MGAFLLNQWVLAARARPCAARPVFLGSLTRQTGRCASHLLIQHIEALRMFYKAVGEANTNNSIRYTQVFFTNCCSMHNTPVTETFTAPLGNASEVFLPLPNWSTMREAEGSCTICCSAAGLCTYSFLQCFPRQRTCKFCCCIPVFHVRTFISRNRNV